ncbi:MAG: hypothetical protein C0473_01035 [Cyanobacteria bacterium DS3.002]|jgi:hypothetical protein|nr:hypothetical protein [Cyanobacteria bacterium DS3.002]
MAKLENYESLDSKNTDSGSINLQNEVNNITNSERNLAYSAMATKDTSSQYLTSASQLLDIHGLDALHNSPKATLEPASRPDSSSGIHADILHYPRPLQAKVENLGPQGYAVQEESEQPSDTEPPHGSDYMDNPLVAEPAPEDPGVIGAPPEPADTLLNPKSGQYTFPSISGYAEHYLEQDPNLQVKAQEN